MVAWDSKHLWACRSFGIFNMSLWDDVFAEFTPLTEKDIIIVGVARHSSLVQAGILPHTTWHLSLCPYTVQHSSFWGNGFQHCALCATSMWHQGLQCIPDSTLLCGQLTDHKNQAWLCGHHVRSSHGTVYSWWLIFMWSHCHSLDRNCLDWCEQSSAPGIRGSPRTRCYGRGRAISTICSSSSRSAWHRCPRWCSGAHMGRHILAAPQGPTQVCCTSQNFWSFAITFTIGSPGTYYLYF